MGELSTSMALGTDALGYFPCQDPVTLAGECDRQEPPLPKPFLGKANSFRTAVGPAPARAWLLMLRGDLNKLADAKTKYLLGSFALRLLRDDGTYAKLPGLNFLRGWNLTPGYAGDPQAMYLTEWVDARYTAGAPLDFAANVRGRDLGVNTYYTFSGGNSPYAWGSLHANLWTQANLNASFGAAPALPFAPDGLPESWEFWGVDGWPAYHRFLLRLCCAFALDPTKAPALGARIVRLGANDPAFTSATARLAGDPKHPLIWDDEILESPATKLPASVVVCFRRAEKYYGGIDGTSDGTTQWHGTPIYSIQVASPIVGAPSSGKSIVLWDDLAAVMDYAGTVQNLAALQSRATERAADFYRALWTGGGRMRRIYSGYVIDPGFLPGSQVSALTWRDTGSGPQTEILRVPFIPAFDARAAEFIEAPLEDVSLNLRPPDLARQSFPVYPDLMQSLVCNSLTPNGEGMYDAFVERYDAATNTMSNGESAWIVDENLIP